MHQGSYEQQWCQPDEVEQDPPTVIETETRWKPYMATIDFGHNTIVKVEVNVVAKTVDYTDTREHVESVEDCEGNPKCFVFTKQELDQLFDLAVNAVLKEVMGWV
jgi:hypothetical protein